MHQVHGRRPIHLQNIVHRIVVCGSGPFFGPVIFSFARRWFGLSSQMQLFVGWIGSFLRLLPFFLVLQMSEQKSQNDKRGEDHLR